MGAGKSLEDKKGEREEEKEEYEGENKGREGEKGRETWRQMGSTGHQRTAQMLSAGCAWSVPSQTHVGISLPS